MCVYIYIDLCRHNIFTHTHIYIYMIHMCIYIRAGRNHRYSLEPQTLASQGSERLGTLASGGNLEPASHSTLITITM